MSLTSISLEHLQEMVGDEAVDFLREIAPTFITDFSEHMSVIRKAIGSGDLETAWKSAHTVKGSSANVGAVHLSDSCAALEKQARDGHAEGLHALMDDLEKEFRKVHLDLSEFIAKS